MGKFTKELESKLIPALSRGGNDNSNMNQSIGDDHLTLKNSSNQDDDIPKFFLHGYYGPTNRLEEVLQQQHNVGGGGGVVSRYIRISRDYPQNRSSRKNI